MTIEYFKSANDLIKAFDVENNPVYEKITPLNDRKVGFSFQRKYPDNIRYYPPKTIKGKDDTVALIHVVYEHPDEVKKQSVQDSRIPFIIRVTAYSRYTAEHFDYNFDDVNCPTKESVERSKLTPKPIDLNYEGDFFYDHNDNKFYDDKGKSLSGTEILDQVFKDHCYTIHLFKGLKLRFKLGSRSLCVLLFDVLVKAFKKILISVFGRTLDESDSVSAYFSGYKRENLKKLSTESLTVFGYSTARKVILLFCFLTVIAYTSYFFTDTKSKYLKTVFSNSFLSLTFSIVIIWLLDEVLPIFLFRIINMIIKWRSTLVFRRFKAF